jgi:hypothetical protein
LKQDAMNLFLGYYLPYRHSVPLWELETDYYLHNFHVRAGRGSMCSMKNYQRSFGIDWKSLDLTDDQKPTPSPPQKTPPPPPPVLLNSKLSSSRNSLTQQCQSGAPMIQEEESIRIANVRRRCKSQNKSLALWWKAALQSNIKQRMWMKLGPNQTDQSIPSCFEHLYQPEKLGQFDRFFTRAWTMPVRRSHVAQQSDGPAADGTGGLLRVISDNFARESYVDDEAYEVDEENLDTFVKSHGMAPAFEPTVKTFLGDNARGSKTVTSHVSYLDYISYSANDTPEVYLNYVRDSNYLSTLSQVYRPETIEEFKSCLHDYTLQADDVAGINEVS